MKHRVVACFAVLFFIHSAYGQYVVDPLPYAPIANPLPDTMDQLYRDSATIQIGRVRVNQAGYRPQDRKVIYYVGDGASSFTVIDDETGAEVGSGILTSTGETISNSISIRASNNATLTTGGDTRYTMESATVGGTVYQGVIPDDLGNGRYRVRVGSDESGPFVINEHLYGWVRDAVIKFFGVNRCGDSQSWFHPPCHLHDAVTGGWHDCGDHLKEGITQSFSMAMLGLTAACFQDRDADSYGANHAHTVHTDGIPDILYEAKHGADYVIQSYDKAGGTVANMNTSIGDFGDDHQWWGRPEYQDSMPQGRGGPVRAARNEVGANVTADFATGMALVGKLWEPYDSEYAARCIQIAAELYDHAISAWENEDVTESPAYNGNGVANDELALAAVALLWATENTRYLQELAYDPTIGPHANLWFDKISFEGGWFHNNNVQFSHDNANTDWASVHVPALYGFFKLILTDEELCSRIGVQPDERLVLLEKTLYQMVYNLCAVSNLEGQTIQLPNHDFQGPVGNTFGYESIWKIMHTQQEWVWNRYQMGNIIEMYCYSDMAYYVQGMELPNTPASTDWKAPEVRQVMVEAMDYMLGKNPWDVSMIYGVGNKNFNHPHHRAANPEGKNVPGAFYRYVPPVGALQGGYSPETSVYEEHYDDYHHSEIGIDGSAVTIFAVTALAKNQPVRPPSADVRIVYVGHDRAIIDIRQDKYGDATIRYGQTTAEPNTLAHSDSSAVYHRIELENLLSGTEYHFDVTVADLFGNDSIILNQGEHFTFTTADSPPGAAEISNVKVCRVTSDSAEIFWFTPNGEYDSRVVFDTQTPPTIIHDGDIAGHPVRFHYVKIGGLQEKTTYYFHVESNGTIDDNDGEYYTFTTPVEHVDFDLRTVSYDSGGLPTLGLVFVNQDHKSYDSLELRLYMRGTEEEMADLGARVDIGIKYGSDGFQDEHFKETVDIPLQREKPVMMPETYDETDNTYAWYFTIPLGDAVMESQARFRLDILFVKRNLPFNDDLLNEPATHRPGGNDWSWRPHSRPEDPFDFGGIEEGQKEDVDTDYWNMEINRYITVYRKNEFVWGYSPSHIEQSSKKTNYEMTAQVTSPLHNPSEDYVALENHATAQVEVSGWAQITEDGSLNEIWVNGHELENSADLIRYDAATDKYNFNVMVPVDQGANVVDITLFGGPSIDCEECYGCAFSNHHFYIEFTGAEQYDGELVIRDAATNAVIDPKIKIDTTSFIIEVNDPNGNIDSMAVDSLYAYVTSPATGDSNAVVLRETGAGTGIFIGAPMLVTSAGAAVRPSNAISAFGGDSVWIRYQDPFNPSDYSSTFLYSTTTHPVSRTGWFLDTNGDGVIDSLTVLFTGELAQPPDLISIGFPDTTASVDIAGPYTVTGSRSAGAPLTGFSDLATGFSEGIQFSSGSVTVTHRAQQFTSTFTLHDSAGPVLTHATLVENKNANSDVLIVSFSEIVDTTRFIGLRLNAKHADDAITNLTVLSHQPDPMGGVRIVVSGERGISPGDSLYLTPGQDGIPDVHGNYPHPNNKPVLVGFMEGAAFIESAWYTDQNADGVIDHGYIEFDRDIALQEIASISLRYNGERYSVDKGFLSEVSDSAVSIAVNHVINSDALVTNGLMSADVRFTAFPDTVRTIDFIDRAAPVIKSAVFIPGRVADQNIPRVDTLVVLYSEPVKEITNTEIEPFILSSTAHNNYRLNLTIVENQPYRHIFVVNSYNPPTVSYPRDGDEIWIDTTMISDANNFRQRNPNNRRCPLTVRTVPYQWTLTVRPNPLPFGTPYMHFSLQSITPVIGSSTEGHLSIFDGVGNLLTERTFVPVNDTLQYLWDATNNRRRKVGPGTYMAIVQVLQNKSVVFEKRVMVGIKKE